MSRDTMNLAGEWRVALDPRNEGVRERWCGRTFEETIALPGTTDEARIGEFADEHCEDRLSRIWRWIGPAWYQRTVTIPERWQGKRITLFLERTKDSQVWVDDTWAGSDDSLSTPHEFDLSAHLTPGRHTLTILVDNAKLPPVGPCHQVDERTQTNWNGIVGRMELTATEKIWIEDLQAHPQVEMLNADCRMPNAESQGHGPAHSGHAVRVVATVGNAMVWKGEASVTVRAEVLGRRKNLRIASRRTKVALAGRSTRVEMDLPVPAGVPLWDEFDRSLIRLTMQTSTAPATTALAAGKAADQQQARSACCTGKALRDTHSVTFGMRSFAASRGQFVINGRPTFLRGKNDCALFPLTGYAPMEKKEWLRLLGISAGYGINHYRFHSWCPPEAAFAAADELGIYFQIELPNKREITAPGNKDYKPPKEAYETLAELEGDGGPPAIRTAYLTREGERILRAYGNHPSFVMMTLGNELGGDVAVMKGMCDHFRSLDSRHLYAMGTGHFHWDIKYREGDEFWVTRATAPGQNVRGASWESECHIDHRPPSTTVDYRSALQGVPVPVVGHEMAQYEVYPDFSEIRKYKGVLKARNLEIFRERLKAAGMLDQAAAFLKASGALSTICHREDVEAALRTPGFGGFQMLDLQDFSGQGTALVGILNVFMQSKGLIAPEAWREFCCETVPLLWMTKYTWTNDETFHGRIRVAHYGAADLKNQSITWQIEVLRSCRRQPVDDPRSSGPDHGDPRAGARGYKEGVAAGASRRTDHILARGETRAIDIPTGTVTEVDLVSAELGSIKTAQKLVITLSVKGAPYRNLHNFWVYPAKVQPAAPKNMLVARAFSRKVQDALAAGKRVLLLGKPDTLKQSVAMAFQTGFWSPMFRKNPIGPNGKETPGTQGILCDPNHPLFKDFPTEFHGNWQWWQLVKNSRAMILDSTPRELRPTVQVIDGFDRNHKLGLIFEAKVGKGRLLICSIDLLSLQEHPEARQLLACLYRYVSGAEFDPEHELIVKTIRRIVQA